MKRTFKLMKTTQVAVGKRFEDNFLYVETTGGGGVVEFHAGTTPFTYRGKESQKSLLKKITNAYCIAVLDTPEDSSYDEVIKELTIN